MHAWMHACTHACMRTRAWQKPASHVAYVPSLVNWISLKKYHQLQTCRGISTSATVFCRQLKSTQFRPRLKGPSYAAGLPTESTAQHPHSVLVFPYVNFFVSSFCSKWHCFYQLKASRSLIQQARGGWSIVLKPIALNSKYILSFPRAVDLQVKRVIISLHLHVLRAWWAWMRAHVE